jgi:hypothetical protein
MLRDDIQAASAAIRTAIERTEGPLPPTFLVEFLLRHWRVYLARLHAQCGADARLWHDAVALTQQLIWSVSPKITNAERAALAGSLKSLLEGVRQGATVAAVAESVQRVFFDDLSRWHLWLINPASNPAPTAAATPKSALDLGATLRLDTVDPRYRKIMDYLESDNIEEIAI